MYNRPEILAPCGNMNSLKAAIAAGADACYLAGNSFGARAYADNFSDSELLEAIELAHLHNVKVYLTCNTLIKNNEMLGVYDMLEPLTDAGLDAVLVQDYGVMRLVREYLPELPIHTSTQMNILTPEGAKLAKERGASRVVAAREMTIPELARIKKEAEIEVEAFVHGAMCLCYSGRCLMSSMIGGRSGNRGRCAQPCRQRYNGEYLLSMRDLCTLEYIPQLIEAGVDSLKIEGRMKNEYYTAATVEAYRVLVDEYMNGTFTEEKVKKYEDRLLDIFNRGGFSSGYMLRDRSEEVWDEALIDSSMPGRRGVKVGEVSKIKDGQVSFKALKDINVGDDLLIDTDVAILITSNKTVKEGDFISLNAPETRRVSKGMSIYRNRCSSLIQEIDGLINRDTRIPINGYVRAVAGKRLKITFSRGDISATVKGDVVAEASNRPVDRDTISNKVSQLGNTEFYMDNLEVETDGKSFVRIGDLSELRRNAVEELKKAIADSFRREPMYYRGDNERFLRYEVCKDSNHILDNNYYFSFADPYQVEAFLESPDIYNELNGISGDIYIIFDLGLGKYSAEGTNNKASGNDAEKIASFNKICDVGLIKELEEKVQMRMMANHVSNVRFAVGLPYINRGEYEIPDEFGEMVDALYIRNIDDLASVRDRFEGKTFILANSLYAYNNLAVVELNDILATPIVSKEPNESEESNNSKESKGFNRKLILETSLELSKREIDNMDYIKDYYSIYYGKLPVMVTSGLRDTTGILKDDKGYAFNSVKCDGLCYNVIFGDRPQSLHGYTVKRMYSFTDETPAEVKDVLSADPKYIKDNKFTRGHIEKGI